MKFGIRECCDVVFRAKAPMKVGNKIFYKGEPVIYFDSLKTSTLEGAATTVYAQGGRGNARLMSWDGERTVTFTMEDALISPEGLAILTGAGLIQAGEKDANNKPITVKVHCTEKVEIPEVTKVAVKDEDGQDTEETVDSYVFSLDEKIYEGKGAGVYVMVLDGNDNMMCEPFSSESEAKELTISGNTITIAKATLEAAVKDKVIVVNEETAAAEQAAAVNLIAKVLVDYYTEKESGAMEISITPDKFGGAFYIEGSTLFREYPSQLDLPAEIIIPNGRVQSNFTFTMASSGDPSTFTFTVDAFPDYTRFNQTEKVLSTIQVIGGGSSVVDLQRDKTNTARKEDADTGLIG